MKSKLIAAAILLFLVFTNVKAQQVLAQSEKKGKEYEVAVYYFPNYHPDSINARWHGMGWTEWEVVRAAKPRFKGHEQPKVPSWGYFNEADPKWAAKEIDLAADNDIDCFIYDWYWYSNTGQYLQEGLEKGFLKAPNRNRLKFALMWANHDWLNIQPATFDNNRVKLTEGEVTKELWDTISSYIVDNYFKQPNYWKIDGKPYFSIYEIITFINGLGGLDEAKKAIQLLDDKTKKAGFPGVHFNIMSWMVNDDMAKSITGTSVPANARKWLKLWRLPVFPLTVMFTTTTIWVKMVFQRCLLKKPLPLQKPIGKSSQQITLIFCTPPMCQWVGMRAHVVCNLIHLNRKIIHGRPCLPATLLLLLKCNCRKPKLF
jgi:hypothetical protein